MHLKELFPPPGSISSWGRSQTHLQFSISGKLSSPLRLPVKLQGTLLSASVEQRHSFHLELDTDSSWGFQLRSRCCAWSQDRPRTSSRLRCNRFMKSPDSVYLYLQKERGARQDYRKTMKSLCASLDCAWGLYGCTWCFFCNSLLELEQREWSCKNTRIRTSQNTISQKNQKEWRMRRKEREEKE
jgi:hypothetical protein